MGNLCAPGNGPDAEPKESFDPGKVLVGAPNRFNNDMEKLEDIEEPRKPMAALELLAEHETVYRRKNQIFKDKPPLLTYSTDSDMNFLRTVLDEPIGRYYLEEFCREKADYKPLQAFVCLWRDIYLVDRVQITIKDVQKLVELEQDAVEKTKNQIKEQATMDKSSNFGSSFFMKTKQFQDIVRQSGSIKVSKSKLHKIGAEEEIQGQLQTSLKQAKSRAVGHDDNELNETNPELSRITLSASLKEKPTSYVSGMENSNENYDQESQAEITEIGLNNVNERLSQRERRKQTNYRVKRNQGRAFPLGGAGNVASVATGITYIHDEPYNLLAEEQISVAAGIRAREEEDIEGVFDAVRAILKKYTLDEDKLKLNATRAPTLVEEQSEEPKLTEPEVFLLEFGFLEQIPEKTRQKYPDIANGIPDFEERVKEAFANAARRLDQNDVKALRSVVLDDLQNLCEEVLILMNIHIEFRVHSEFRRYEKKYARVYNFICHKDFDFMAPLGKGSFGRVVRVRKRTTRQQYALKIMSKKKILAGAESREQVIIEKQVLVLCFACKFVCGLHFAFQTSRAIFITLTLLEGGTLVQGMAAQPTGRLSFDQIRTIAAQIILGLNHMHMHGILYRDLKPVNIMLDNQGTAVLTDMGLCAKYKYGLFEDPPKDPPVDEDTDIALLVSKLKVDRELVEPYNEDLIEWERIRAMYHDPNVKTMAVLKPNELKCVGTPGYRSPELLSISSSAEIKKNERRPGFKPNRGGYGHEVDYWALGVTLYYLYSGGAYPYRNTTFSSCIAAPADMKSTEINQQRVIPDLRKEFASKDPYFGDLLQGLLEKSPSNRLGHSIRTLQDHPFFTAYDYDTKKYGEVPRSNSPEVKEIWKRFQNLDIKPVYVPNVRKHLDTERPQYKGLSDAMRQFAQENVLELFGGAENDIIEDFKHIRARHQKYFDDWDFIPDELLEQDWKLIERYFQSPES